MAIQREISLKVAESYLGRPYTWAGDDPMAGFDCSGLIVECLKASGVIPRRTDLTANMMMQKDEWPEVALDELRPGDLVFFGNTPSHADHIEMVYRAYLGRVFTIGASGGGSQTKTLADAIRDNAFIKIRPLNTARFIKARSPYP